MLLSAASIPTCCSVWNAYHISLFYNYYGGNSDIEASQKTKIMRELPFISDPHITHLPASCIASLPIGRFHGLVTSYCGSETSSLDAGCPPPYTPSLQVKLVLPQQLVLIQGQALPAKVIINKPKEFRGATIYMRSVGITLRTSIAAGVGNNARKATIFSPVCNITGMMRVDSEQSELDLSSWGNVSVILNTTPTCTSDIFSVSHSFEITAGLSNGSGNLIQVREFGFWPNGVCEANTMCS